MSAIARFDRKRSYGFTIVELLVVIVVIGILASITFVSFNGIQDRARSVQSQSLAKDVLKKAEIFYILNNRYPTITEMSATTTSSESRLPAGVTLYTYNDAYTNRLTADWTKAAAYCLSPSGGIEVTWWDYTRTGDYRFSNDVGKSYRAGDISGGCA